ncbi:hypothetical protein EV701_117158 [Chthoniobacter flavus]|uniref:hypothetical protein n=1 Tax=Chthoniobacter flavus TaxID=191863 RepID=UPI0010533D98|nr:hypothetical protein [Chthoniobacter flavus]TCO88555.1 hypothetical protein EV701_117158 [Chthoniobacter flavus]
MASKIIILISGFLILAATSPSVAVSIEKFKSLGEAERAKAIEVAPLAERDTLRKIDRHIRYVAKFEGEDRFQAAKAEEIIYERGLSPLRLLFDTRMQLWDQYTAGVRIANKNAGLALDDRRNVELAFKKRSDLLTDRYLSLIQLLLRVEPSKAATDLSENAWKWNVELRARYHLNESTPEQRITKDEMDAIDRRMDSIYEEVDRLKKVSAKRFQEEYDQFPDEKISPPLGR